jgi:N-succinyldiaminopimelate aminotransferase
MTTDIAGLAGPGLTGPGRGGAGQAGAGDGLAFCRALPELCGVVAVPNVVFYDTTEAGRSQVRFAFCKRPQVLAEAAARLARLRTAS